MRWLTLIAFVALLAGCTATVAPETATQENSNQPPGTQAQAPTPGTDPNASASVSQSGGNGGGISPMTTAPIPNAPVSGSESLQGGGSNVGAVAKDRAKQAASQASTPNMGTGGEGE